MTKNDNVFTHLLADIQQLVAGDTQDAALTHLLNGIAKLTGAAIARIVGLPTGAALATTGQWFTNTAQMDMALCYHVQDHGPLPLTRINELPKIHENAAGIGDNRYIAAFSLVAGGREWGALWLAFADAPDFDAATQTYINILVTHAALIVATYEENADSDALRQYRALFNSMRDPALLLDSAQNILVMNPAAEKVFNVRGNRMIGQPFLQLVPPVELLRFLHGKPDKEPAKPYVAIAEHSFYPLLTDVTDENDAPHGKMLMLVEISHFRRLNENMTMFLQTVSHDLRSPLTAAKGFVDMLSMVGELNEKQSMMKEKILTSIVDMTNLVEKVLDAGRLDPEMGAYELRREMCDPAAVVEKVTYNLMAAAQKKNIQLYGEVAPNVPPMNLDTMMLERALMNLAENAIKYTPEGGQVVVEAVVVGENLHLMVRDNGFGIPADKQGKLFDRGSRIRRDEHKAIRGSGLGLFIVKNVAQQHGGDATVESTEGQGSTFRISIPISGPNAPTE